MPDEQSGTDFLAQRFATQGRAVFRPAALRLCAWFDDLLGLMFGERATITYQDQADVAAHARSLEKELAGILDSTALAEAFMAGLPYLQGTLREDASAIHRADPAATSASEVIAIYNSFYAIAAYRVAHRLAGIGVPLLPRALTEYAHGRTGVDIHPDARIGRRFCIDHGTGVVIGQTTVIGDDVRLYQGVTLGGMSLSRPEPGVKRHPTIGDRVIIYANATVLGGDTVVGHDSVLGGNVWVTQSVAPHSKVIFDPSVRTLRRT